MGKSVVLSTRAYPDWHLVVTRSEQVKTSKETISSSALWTLEDRGDYYVIQNEHPSQSGKYLAMNSSWTGELRMENNLTDASRWLLKHRGSALYTLSPIEWPGHYAAMDYGTSTESSTTSSSSSQWTFAAYIDCGE